MLVSYRQRPFRKGKDWQTSVFATGDMTEQERPKEYSCGHHGVLRVLQTDRFKVGQLTFSSVMPITKENAVLAPLMLSVLRRGTERYPTLADINRRLDELYGSTLWVQCFYRGDRLILGFGMDLLDSSYLPEKVDLVSGLMEILEQVFYHPLLDTDGLLLESYVESEKKQQCDDIRSLKNVPAQYASTQARRLFYRGTPAGIPLYGTEKEVKAVTREQLTDYWIRWRKNLSPDCFYVGGESPEKIAQVIRSVFEREENRNALPLRGLSDYPVIANAPKVLKKEMKHPSAQSHLVLGYRTGGVTINTPDLAAMVVMNEILGASSSSLLFRTVREKLSLCYSVSSVYDGFRGALFVLCSLSAKNRERAEEEILKQIDNLAAGRFTNDDLDSAKQSLRMAYRQLEDRPGSMESYWTGRIMAGVPQTPAESVGEILRVTPQDISRVAGKLTQGTVYFLRGTRPEEPDFTNGNEQNDDE